MEIVKIGKNTFLSSIYEPHGDGGNTTLRALQPGFFDWNGLPAKREAYAETPKFFNGAKWDWVDEGKFMHEARRVTEAEFKESVALRTSQHTRFLNEAEK